MLCGLTFLAFCSDLFQNDTGLVKGLDSQARGRRCKYIHAPAARVALLPTPAKISAGHVLENSAHRLFLSFFLGESLRKGSQHCFILRDILFRGNYVTNRCPGSARNSGSAAAGPGNGSRLVKCQRRPRHWISTEPTARRSTYRFAEPERVKQYIKIGTSFALAGFR